MEIKNYASTTTPKINKNATNSRLNGQKKTQQIDENRIRSGLTQGADLGFQL